MQIKLGNLIASIRFCRMMMAAFFLRGLKGDVGLVERQEVRIRREPPL
jgi:hypothetical protein